MIFIRVMTKPRTEVVRLVAHGCTLKQVSIKNK